MLWEVVQELHAINASLHEIAEEMKEDSKLKGGSIMYIVRADNPDVGYHITPPTVTDSEGNPVPSGELTFEVTSDNPGAVEVVPSGPTDGNTHFGAPNPDGTPALANVNVLVKNAAGTVLGSFGGQFTVTPGDPSAIAGGTITFDGLSEV